VTERLLEVALTREEIDEILLRCGSRALLVGGQALATWAVYFGVEPMGVLSAKVTSDVDFIGTRQVAEELRKTLGWKIWLPTPDDATAQTAKITSGVAGGGVKQIDFLSGIVGLDTAKVEARAVEISLVSGALVRVLHPLDVLESRLRNLDILPSKQNATGVAQAELAIAVAGRFVDSLVESGAPLRTVLDAAKRVGQIALDPRLCKVAFDFGLNPLDAVSPTRIHAPEFRLKYWPRLIARFAERRKKNEERAKRMSGRRKIK